MRFEEEILLENQDIETEKQYLEKTIEDAAERLEELNEQELENVEGGATCPVIRATKRYIKANAYSNFYRVMLSSCPGTVTGFSARTNVSSYKKSGNTYWVYRRRAGRSTFTVTSKKGNQVYYNYFTVDFR